MTPNPIETSPLKRRRWFFTLGWIGLALVALLVVAYFVATSNAFFQGVILPRVGRSIDSTVTVTHASISPFSQVILRDLKVQPRGQEPVLLAKEVRARYRLMAMLGGQIHIEEAVIESPKILFIGKADGANNWDPILKTLSQEKPGQTPPPPPKSSKPLRVDLNKLVVSHATLDFTQAEPNGNTLRAGIPELNLELAGVKNGQTARFTQAANFEITRTSPTNVSKVTGSLKSDLSVDLGGDLMYDRVEGQAELAIPTATGAFADAAGLTTTLIAKLSSTEVKQLALQFAKGSAMLGKMTVSGPLNLRTREGLLNVAVNGIGSEVLSLAGGRHGVSFGETKLSARCDLVLKNNPQIITAMGTVTGATLSLTQGSRTTPKIDFQLAYNLKVDFSKTNAMLSQFTLNATQNARPLLQAALARELQVDFSKGAEGVPDSTFDVTLSHLDFAQWQAVAGPEVRTGVLNAKLGLNIQKAGQLVAFDLASQLTDLSAEFASNRVVGLSLSLGTRGTVTEFSQVDLANCSVQATQAGQPVLSVKASGRYNTRTAEANFQTESDAFLAQMSAVLARPDMQLASGTAKFTGRIVQSNPSPGQTNTAVLDQEVAGDLQISKLQVRPPAGKMPLPPQDARLELDASLRKQILELRQVQLTLTPTERARNQLQLTGRMDLSQSNAFTGHLKLAAEALDLTAYYDLYESQSASSASPSTSTNAPTSQPELEPLAVDLPLRQFTLEANIGRLYLREIAITNWMVTTKVDGGKIIMDPLQLTINGAPASGTVDLNLGLPGYQYRVALRGQAIPLAPWVNSFQPDRKGQIDGTVTASAQLNGAGVTGPNLQKNLAGQVDIGTTNLNLKVINVRSSLLKSVINVIVSLPEIIRNPAGALSSIVKTFSGPSQTSSSGWVDDLSQAPIDAIALRCQAGKGRVDVQSALVQSSAFRVETQGPITLAPILTNSTIDFPVTMALRRSLAAAIGQVTAETPTNLAYVKLPDFLTMQGTLGESKKKLNYPALGQMALKLGGGITGGSGQATVDQVTGALSGLQKVFGGKDSTNKVSTSTNQPTPKDILDGLFRPRPAASTNSAQPTNATPKKGSLFDLLK